jgi:asparaginyl-tRNA synthetase
MNMIPEPSSLEFVEKRHLSFRHPLTKLVLKVQSDACFYLGKFLRSEGFVELRPPIISPCTDPGIRGAKHAIIDFYGRKYKVTASMIMHKQLAITAFDKIFAFSPNVRLEPEETVKTGRHLVEFTQLDLEAAYYTREKIMRLAERMLRYAIASVRRSCKEELAALGRKLKVPKIPFKEISHEEAIDMLASHGFEVAQGSEIPWDAEQFLSEKAKGFLWIKDYPIGSRGFYDKRGSKFLLSFDLLYPEGYGEAISGSEREYEAEKVKRNMRDAGLPLEEYAWYLELLEHGIPSSAGFGIGIERFTRYLCGLDAVWQAAAFPKVAGIYSP